MSDLFYYNLIKLLKYGIMALALEHNQNLEITEDSPPQSILEWAVDRYYPWLTMATAFGAEGCVLIDMLSRIEPRVRIFNLDTGYQFPETLAMVDRIRGRDILPRAGDMASPQRLGPRGKALPRAEISGDSPPARPARHWTGQDGAVTFRRRLG